MNYYTLPDRPPKVGEYWVNFTGGGVAVLAVGDKITGATSGAFAYVESIHLASGTWAGGDAEGTLFLKGLTGTFQEAENLDTSGQANIGTMTTVPMARNILWDGLNEIDAVPDPVSTTGIIPMMLAGWDSLVLNFSSMVSSAGSHNIRCDLFGSDIDGKFSASLANHDAARQKEFATPNTTAKKTDWIITGLPFMYIRFNLTSLGTDKYTVTGSFRRFRLSTERLGKS